MLDIHAVSLQVCRDSVAIIRAISTQDRNLADQLRRAVTSVPLNIGESDGLNGGNRRQRRLTALGSAREVSSCMQVAVAMSYIDAVPEEMSARLDHVIGVLVKVARP